MRRIILACALAGVLAVPAKAASLEEQLIGAWTLVSCDPTRTVPYCPPDPNPDGIWIFDASGRYAVAAAARGRPKLSTRSAEEYKAIATGYAASFGTWSVNEADKTLTLYYNGPSLLTNSEGGNGKYIIRISGDELMFDRVVYSFLPGERKLDDVWRRIKK